MPKVVQKMQIRPTCSHRKVVKIVDFYINENVRVEKLTASLNVHEWRACIASMVYDLLHPEDSLTLRIVGIFIDPTHEKVTTWRSSISCASPSRRKPGNGVLVLKDKMVENSTLNAGKKIIS
jgi:hypothetical protein